MDFTCFVIVIVFFLLDKGHEAENWQKEGLFLLHYHFPMEGSSESFSAYIGMNDHYMYMTEILSKVRTNKNIHVLPMVLYDRQPGNRMSSYGPV